MRSAIAPSDLATSASIVEGRIGAMPLRSIAPDGFAMAQKDMPASRERRMRRAAARKGLEVRKLERGKDRGRFQLLDPEFGGPRASPSREHPTSFSLEEAESYLEA